MEGDCLCYHHHHQQQQKQQRQQQQSVACTRSRECPDNLTHQQGCAGCKAGCRWKIRDNGGRSSWGEGCLSLPPSITTTTATINNNDNNNNQWHVRPAENVRIILPPTGLSGLQGRLSLEDPVVGGMVVSVTTTTMPPPRQQQKSVACTPSGEWSRQSYHQQGCAGCRAGCRWQTRDNGARSSWGEGCHSGGCGSAQRRCRTSCCSCSTAAMTPSCRPLQITQSVSDWLGTSCQPQRVNFGRTNTIKNQFSSVP